MRVQFVKEQLTFTGEDTAMANLLLSVMGAFAEFERSLIGERQREGICPGQGARGVPRSEEVSQRGPGMSAARASKSEGHAGPRVRHQPRDGLPVPAYRTLFEGLLGAVGPSAPRCWVR